MKNNETIKRVQIKFRNGSIAQRELEFKLCDISYDQAWHKKHDPLIEHWLETGDMCETLAEEVLYEFECIACGADGYEEDRTYRNAVDSVIHKLREAYPELKGYVPPSW